MKYNSNPLHYFKFLFYQILPFSCGFVNNPPGFFQPFVPFSPDLFELFVHNLILKRNNRCPFGEVTAVVLSLCISCDGWLNP
jgi:hypothetical protein